jgi:hypothetical protein
VLEAEKRAAELACQQAEAEHREIEKSLRLLADNQRKMADPSRHTAVVGPKPDEIQATSVHRPVAMA